MSKVFTSEKFIEKLKHVESLPTTYYSVSGGNWASWNGWSWNFDCVILIKALLWGWNENKNVAHGGAVYLSNGVPDVDADTLITLCENVSSDFNNITAGELLWMDGHVGVYIGNGKVIECTAGWEGKVLYSEIGNDGRRSRNGVQIGYWKKHGKLPYIEYINPKPIDTKVNIYYQVETKEDGVLPMVKNTTDYAGWKNHAIRYLAMKVDKGSIKYRITTVSGKTLDWITKCDIKDHNLGCAGNGEAIATVEAIYYTPEDIVKQSGYKYIYYKVNDYPYQKDTIKGDGFDGYAGVKGITATKFQAYID